MKHNFSLKILASSCVLIVQYYTTTCIRFPSLVAISTFHMVHKYVTYHWRIGTCARSIFEFSPRTSFLTRNSLIHIHSIYLCDVWCVIRIVLVLVLPSDVNA
jgi:hypothetical protein